MNKCIHQLNTEYCSWCNKPQKVCFTPEVIRALFYIAEMSRTHDDWEIAKEAPEKAKLILEFIQGKNSDLLKYFNDLEQPLENAKSADTLFKLSNATSPV